MKKDKNYIGTSHYRNFNIDTYLRALKVCNYIYHKKSDVLDMINSNNTEGTLKKYFTNAKNRLTWNGTNYLWYKTKSRKSIRIGCELYSNEFLNKIKKALLSIK